MIKDQASFTWVFNVATFGRVTAVFTIALLKEASELLSQAPLYAHVYLSPVPL